MRFQNIRVTRRVALRLLAGVALLGASLLAPFGRASAQEQNVDPSFSNQILPTLGLPTLDLVQTAAGVQGVPASIAAGRYLVNYSGEGVLGYLLFAQVPAGLSDEEALKQAKDAGTNDIQGEGWVYGGGTYVEPGATVQIVVELTPGDWHVVASRQSPEEEGPEAEIYELVPLAVMDEGASGTPAAVASPVAEVPVDVRVEMETHAYVIDDPAVAAGPRIWEFANTGEQSHHVVIMRTPRAIAQSDVDAMFAAFSSATPPAEDLWFLQSTWVGYTALVSPGYTVWNEFDFDPGTYVLLCFIADTETGMPHLMMGMWANFTVE